MQYLKLGVILSQNLWECGLGLCIFTKPQFSAYKSGGGGGNNGGDHDYSNYDCTFEGLYVPSALFQAVYNYYLMFTASLCSKM